MFADTITVTVNAVPKTLIRVNQDNYCGEYLMRGATEQYSLNIRNTKYTDAKRGGVEVHRHNFELVHTVYAVAPATKNLVRKMYAVLENEATDSSTPYEQFAAGFVGLLTTANVTKVMNWES